MSVLRAVFEGLRWIWCWVWTRHRDPALEPLGRFGVCRRCRALVFAASFDRSMREACAAAAGCSCLACSLRRLAGAGAPPPPGPVGGAEAPSPPPAAAPAKPPIDHETDHPDCWCEPRLLQECPECAGPAEYGPEVQEAPPGAPAGCWRCGGAGLVRVYSRALPILVVHRVNRPRSG